MDILFFGAEPLGSKTFQLLAEFSSSGQNLYSGIANTYIEILYYLGLFGISLIWLVYPLL